jgi:hypothetical protein
LLCELLRVFPGWEAIKTTRGHYRSCGKDPHACCVSHLLEDTAVVRTGRESTYSPGKDTGRYWDAGASNVHWVIADDDQIAAGTTEAVARVRTAGVLVEGNSFTESVRPDYFVMVLRPDSAKIKRSAKRALMHTSSLYLSSAAEAGNAICEKLRSEFQLDGIPLFTSDNLTEMLQDLQVKIQIFSAKNRQPSEPVTHLRPA